MKCDTSQASGDDILVPSAEPTSSASAKRTPIASPSATATKTKPVASPVVAATLQLGPPTAATTKTPDTSSHSSDWFRLYAIECTSSAAFKTTPVRSPSVRDSFGASSTATPATSPHHGHLDSSSSECDSVVTPPSQVATAATTPGRDAADRPPSSTLPVRNYDLVPVRIQASRAPSAREAYERQTRHLDWTTDRWGYEFVWKAGSEPTEETARELLAFYLNNHDLVRRTRGLGLPLGQATAAAVAEGQARLSLGSVQPFARGAHNVLFEVSFVLRGSSHSSPDSSPFDASPPIVVALLRINHPEDPFYRLESDVATSTFARDVAGVPAPRNFSFDSSAANPLGLEWALVEKMTGRPLNELYGMAHTRVPLREKQAIMDDLVFGQLARHWARLFDHAFLALGSLYLAADGVGAYYTLGPVVSTFFCLGRRLLCEAVDRGPYTHLRHYVRAQMRLVQWELPFLPLRLPPGRGGEDGGVRAWRRHCVKMQAVADWADATLDHADPPLRTFPLHPDLHRGNLLMDAQYQLTAVLDWENLACLPLALYAPPTVATPDDGLGGCKQARLKTLAQLPPLDQIPWAVLYACSMGAVTATASSDSEEEDKEAFSRRDKEDVLPPHESHPQYLARCTVQLGRAGADFGTFPWTAPEYFTPPPSRAVMAASASAHAGAEGPWAALLQHVDRLGHVYMRGDQDEEKRRRCAWLDAAFRFCGGGEEKKTEGGAKRAGVRHSWPPVVGAGAKESSPQGSRSDN